MNLESLKGILEKAKINEVNVKAIQKAVNDGKSMDVIVGMFANKRTTNTDEIRKVVKDYMWKKRMKKEEVELDEDVRKKYKGKEQKAVDGLIMRGGVDSVQKTHDKDPKKFDAMVKRISKIYKEDNTNNVSDDGEGMDKVQPKALKKKFADRKDKDIDNDGDTDKSDEYLHLRRKAITKNMKKKNGNNDNEVEMNPKVDNMKKSESKQEATMNSADKKPEMYLAPDGKRRVRMVPTDKQVANKDAERRIESTSIKSKLLSLFEKENHTPHKDKAEKPEDNLKGAGAKQMKKDIETGAEMRDDDRKGHDDASRAERAGPNGKARPNDSKKGDKNIINKVSDESQKGRKDLSADGFKEELSPLASMKKLSDAFRMVLGEKENINEAMSDAEAHDNALHRHKQNQIDHEAMAAAHKREAEGTKTSHPDHSKGHSWAADEHNSAAEAHKSAADDLRKHGVNSSQYKSSAGSASGETARAFSLAHHHDSGHPDDQSKDAPHLSVNGYHAKMNWHHTKPHINHYQ